MTTKKIGKFLANLANASKSKSKQTTEDDPITIKVNMVTIGEGIPYHDVKDLNANPKPPADCKLQIWEMDTKERQKESDHDAYRAMKEERTWIATFQGLIVKENQKFSFRPDGNPRLAQKEGLDKKKGKIILKMIPLDSTSEKPFDIPMPMSKLIWELTAVLRNGKLSEEEASTIAQYDPKRWTVDVSEVIEPKGAKTSYKLKEKPIKGIGTVNLYLGSEEGTKLTENIDFTVNYDATSVVFLNGPPKKKVFAKYSTQKKLTIKRVFNVGTHLLKQIDDPTRGGFGVAFIKKYSEAHLIDKPGDREFKRQAEEMLGTFSTYKIDKDTGTIKFGYHEINNWKDIEPILSDLRKKIQSKLSLKGLPKICVLEYYGHGEPHWCSMELTTNVAKDFVKKVIDHLSDNIVIPLYCCSCGRDIYDPACERAKNLYGKAYPCEEVGAGSLGRALNLELQRQGTEKGRKVTPTVWAHTTYSHTTRNWFLRVFSYYGTAEFINVLMKTPRVENAAPTLREAVRIDELDPEARKIDPESTKMRHVRPNSKYVRRLENANVIRTVCLQNAGLLSWEWSGRRFAVPPSFEQARKPVNDFFDNIRRRFLAEVDKTEQACPLPEEWVFNDRRTYITGLEKRNKPGGKVYLSEDFEYEENGISQLPSLKLNVQLMKYVQWLSYRICGVGKECVKKPNNRKKPLKNYCAKHAKDKHWWINYRRALKIKFVLKKITHDEKNLQDGVALTIEPWTKANQQNLEKNANQMKNEGLFKDFKPEPRNQAGETLFWFYIDAPKS